MRRKLNFTAGEYYLLHNCGVESRHVFLDNADYHRFLITLNRANSKKPFRAQTMSAHQECFASVPDADRLVDIGAYCLLPDHFCILVRERMRRGISRFMAKLCTSHTLYFNKRYKRVGPLFRGSFRAKHVIDTCLLHYLFSIIHLNPLRLASSGESHESFLKAYGNSSYADYAFNKDRYQSLILNREYFPKDLGMHRSFDAFISACRRCYSQCGFEIPQIHDGTDIFRRLLEGEL